jgi:hypothetical protein
VADRIILLNRNRFLVVPPGLAVLFEGPIAAADITVGLIEVGVIDSSPDI